MKAKLLFLYISYGGLTSLGFQSFTAFAHDGVLVPAHGEEVAHDNNGDDDYDTPDSEEAGEAESEKKSFWKRYKKEILCGIALCAAGVAFRYRVPLKNILNGIVAKKDFIKGDSSFFKIERKNLPSDDKFYITEIKRNGSVVIGGPENQQICCTHAGGNFLFAGEQRVVVHPGINAGETITSKDLRNSINDLYVSRGIRSLDYIIISRGIYDTINVDGALQNTTLIKHAWMQDCDFTIKKIFILNTVDAAKKYNELVEQGHKLFILLHTS